MQLGTVESHKRTTSRDIPYTASPERLTIVPAGGYPAQPWTHGSTLHAVAPSTVTLQDTFGDVGTSRTDTTPSRWRSSIPAPTDPPHASWALHQPGMSRSSVAPAEYAVAVSCTNAGVLPRTLFLTPPFQLSARAWAGNATVLHARVTRAVAAAADDPAVALSGRLPVNVTIPLPIADAAPPPARAAATAVAATTLPAFVALALLSLAAVAAAIAAASARRTLLPLPAVPAAAAHAAAQAPLPAVPQPGAPASPIASSASSPLPCPSRAPSPASLTTGSPPTPPPAVLISVTSAPVINVHVALSAHASQSHGGPRVDTAAYAAVADAPLALAPPPAAVPAFYTPAAAAAVTAAATGAAAQWKPSDLPHADGHGRDGDDDPQRAAAGAGAAAYDEPHDDAAAATIAASPAAATASPTVAGRVAAAEHRASPPIRIGADADADADAADGADTTPSLGDVPSTPCIGRGRRRGNATARPSAPTLLLAPAAGPPRGNARGDGGAACMTVALCKHDGDDGFSVAGNPLFTHVAREGRVLGGAAGAGTGGDATALGVPRARDATVVLIVGDDDDGGDEGAASPGSDDSGAGSPRGSLAFRFDRVAGTDWRTIVGGGARGRWSDRRMRLASRHSAVKLSLTCGSGTQPGVSDSGSATAAVTGVARTSETAAPVGAVDASVWTYFYRRPLVRQWQLSAPPSRPTASKPKPPSVGGSPPSSPPASSSVTMRVPAAMPSPPSLPTLRSDLPLPPAVASPLLPAAAPLASSLGSAPSVATSRVQIAMQPPPPPSLLPQLQPALLSVSLPPPPPLLTQSPPPVLSLPVPPQVPARSLSVAALAPVAAVADGATACVPPFPAAHAPHVSMTASASIAAATAPLQSLPSAADAPTSMPPRAISPLLVVTARPAPPSQLALQAMLARRAGAARTVVAERGAEGDCPSPVVPPSQAAAATVVASRTAASAASAEPVSDAPAAMPPLLAPAADDANAKYARMLRVGVPLLSVAQRMRDDGIASDVIAAFVAARESAPPAAAASEQGTTTPGRTPASALLPATPLRRAASDAAADPPTAAMQATASPLARAALARTSSVQTVARLQSLFDAYERGGGAGTPSASSRAPTPVASPFLLRDAAGKAGGGDVTPLPRAKKVSLLDAKGGQRVGIAINRHFKRVSVGVVARSLLTLEVRGGGEGGRVGGTGRFRLPRARGST